MTIRELTQATINHINNNIMSVENGYTGSTVKTFDSFGKHKEVSKMIQSTVMNIFLNEAQALIKEYELDNGIMGIVNHIQTEIGQYYDEYAV